MNDLKIKNVDVEGNISYDGLAKLEMACFPDDAWSSQTIEALLRASIRYGFVIENDDQPIGYVLLTCFLSWSPLWQNSFGASVQDA